MEKGAQYQGFQSCSSIFLIALREVVSVQYCQSDSDWTIFALGLYAYSCAPHKKLKKQKTQQQLVSHPALAGKPDKNLPQPFINKKFLPIGIFSNYSL